MSKDYTIELCSHHCLKIIYGIVRCTIGKIYSAVLLVRVLVCRKSSI